MNVIQKKSTQTTTITERSASRLLALSYIPRIIVKRLRDIEEKSFEELPLVNLELQIITFSSEENYRKKHTIMITFLPLSLELLPYS